MKKVLLGVIVFSFLLISGQAHANNGSDTTPRIAYWWGKVNQHVDSQGNWLTDPDGTSGANLDKLTYCKKWYPNTTSVSDYANEMINGWREAGNTGGPYPLAVMTIKCITDTVIYPPSNDSTPRIAMWYGKVNQHTGSNGEWLTDPDGVSGAGTYQQWGSEGYGDRKLEYCQKFYPKTTSVEDYKTETITTWREKYNTGGPHTLAVMTTKCVQNTLPPPPPTTCNINSIPSIKVLSPNGGEIYQAGEPIPIKWKTCNIGSDKKIRIQMNLYKSTVSNYTIPMIGQTPFEGTYINNWTPNDGEEITRLDIDNFPAHEPFRYGNDFKVYIQAQDMNNNAVLIADDYSDNLFSIRKGDIKNEEIDYPKDCKPNIFTKTLRFGNRNEQVEVLQIILNDQGYLDDSLVTGYFGSKTRTALRMFQKDMGVLVTGYTGSTSRILLNQLWTKQCQDEKNQIDSSPTISGITAPAKR